MIGIIGGSGVYNITDKSEFIEKKTIKTPYGENPKVSLLKIHDKKIVFLPRHSEEHNYPPHKINYRANIYALNSLGVNQIIATNAVGSLKEEIHPGTFLPVHDFIDFTFNSKREKTFYDNEVVHVDLTEPYCNRLRKAIINNKKVISKGDFVDKGVYVCTEGPRFETPAEIKMFQQMGGDVVGMTGLPETVLSREKQICYSSICLVSNYGASISPNRLTMDEVFNMMEIKKTELINLIYETIKNLDDNFDCYCLNSLDDTNI